MLYRLLPLFFCCALSQAASAQSLPPQKYEPAWVIVDDRVVGELSLDTVQRRQLHEFEVRYQRGFGELMMQEGVISDEELSARVKALSDKREAGIRSVLTPEQYKQWSALMRNEATARPTP